MNQIIKLTAILICLLFANTSWSETLAPQPESMQAMVNSSDVIIIGRLKSIIDSRKFYGYQENAGELEKLDAISGFEIGIPIVDYELKINQILKGEGIGKTIIIRKTHDYVADLKEANKFLQHDIKIRKQLFFLNQNPDGLSYGVSAIMGIMDFKKMNKKDANETDLLASDQLVYYYKGKEYKPFGTATNADDALQGIVDITLTHELR